VKRIQAINESRIANERISRKQRDRHIVSWEGEDTHKCPLVFLITVEKLIESISEISVLTAQ
jgi:hypothetical protein